MTGRLPVLYSNLNNGTRKNSKKFLSALFGKIAKIYPVFHAFEAIYRIFSKFSIEGSSRKTSDGDVECVQALTIEGPGLTGSSGRPIPWEGYVDGKWYDYHVSDCFELDRQYPLKVFTSADLANSRQFPIDGVVRNLNFINSFGTGYTTQCAFWWLSNTAESTTAEPSTPKSVLMITGAYYKDIGGDPWHTNSAFLTSFDGKITLKGKTFCIRNIKGIAKEFI